MNPDTKKSTPVKIFSFCELNAISFTDETKTKTYEKPL